ncbi:MAG TPA: acyl-ACP--UDP-N-acetylglucosamine O-acyltransferase [Isosphaeraceae bacterium]|jgi:UDP-N-acetylglucosamine acyltransferase|nr:acyl-ACP--UDP-N-acetylglucosamine O-acyltransferase [Isosphaeraceae bacterium]
MATLIADTACVDPRAELADDVEVGPYCIVGPDVRIGRGTRLIGHACILGVATLGEFNVVSPFVVIGGDPQDVSYRGTATRVEIGDHNIFREGVTINRGSEKEDGVTRVGSHNFFMATSHVAHDCKVGDRVTMANGSMLGGHVHVESFASLSGGVAVHHYVSIGGYCFVGGQSRIYHDVPPFMLVDGNPSKVRCINIVGLKRNGIPGEGIDALHEAHRLIYRAKMNPKHAEEILRSHGHFTPEVERLLGFVRAQHEGKHGRARERWRK